MARPRVYVNEYGKPVKTNTGVSYNKVRHRFYIIREGGKRQEFKTWQEARAAYQGQQAPGRKMVAVEDTQPLGEILPRIRFGPIPDPELPPGPKLPPDWKPKRYKYYAEDDILGYVKQQLQEASRIRASKFRKRGFCEIPATAQIDLRI